MIKKVNFINSFSFIYNQRPGTPAANIKAVEKKVQKERLIILQNLLEEIQKKENKNKVGRLKEVLIENKMKNQLKYFGRIDNLTPVIVSNVDDRDIGKTIEVRIKSYNRNEQNCGN